MTTQTHDSSRALMWMAGIAVILFSGVGIAAIMGWIPTSMGHSNDSAVTIPELPAKHVTGSSTSSKSSSVTPLVAANNSAATRCAECGIVQSTRAVTAKGEGSGIGAVGGAVVGGLLGNQIGNGRGNTVATALGAVGGAVAGNEVEKRVKTTTAYEVTVRMDDGSTRVIGEGSAQTWRAGDHVRIVDGVLKSNS